MDNLIHLWDKPIAEEIYLIAGWRQWADAGSISSGLPEYLIQQTSARKIGEIVSNGYYLFQIPGTHHLMRPVIQLKNGYRQSMESKSNDFYYAGDDKKGLIIFLGDEPHLHVDQYCEAFLTAVSQLGVKRVVSIAGVFGSMPYDKERQVSCIYSLPRLKKELKEYAVRFSDYEGGTTIDAYMVHMAEDTAVEMVGFFAFVPAYDFSQRSGQPRGLQIDYDYKAWYDLMRRCNHMFGLSFSLTNLEERSHELINSIEDRLKELEAETPQLDIAAYLTTINDEFNENPFDPLTDVWEEGIKGLFDD